MDISTEKVQRNSAERLTQLGVSRLRTSDICLKFSLTMYWLGAACLVALLIRRLCGVGPDWFVAEALAVLPVLAVLIALGAAKKPTLVEAARSIDTACRADDLFLTLAQLQTSGGGYQVVVAEQAEQLAAGIRSSEIVLWRWQQPAGRLAAGVTVFVLAVAFLPQLDPFGAAESANTT